MAAQKGFVFNADTLYQLLIHYTDGECPLGGQVREVVANRYLERIVGLLVESDEWTTAEPLHLRLNGKRVASWTQGQAEFEWTQRAETPKVQS